MAAKEGNTTQAHDFSGLGPCAHCQRQVTQAFIYEQVAEITGLSPLTIKSIARGERSASAEVHKAIADVTARYE